MNKYFKSGRSLVIIFLMLHTLAAAGSTSALRENHCWWTTIGGGYSHTHDPFGSAIAVNHTHRLNYHQLTIRAMHYNDIQIFESSPECYANEFGILYGPYGHFTLFQKERENAAPIWWSMSVSFSAGISYIFGTVRGNYLYSPALFNSIYEEVPLKTVGFPAQLELRLIPSNRISIHLNGSASINSTESFYSGWLGVSYGIQRTNSDLVRHKEIKAL